MSPKTDVIIDVICETSVLHENKSKFEIDDTACERTPLLGPKKTTKSTKSTKTSSIDPAVVALFVFLVTGTMIGFYLLTHEERPLNFQVPLRLIERSEMLSSPPFQFFPVHTLSELILTDSQLPECKNETQCLNVIRNENLPYNFFVGGDGNVYEVLGWNFLSDISEAQSRDKAFVIGFAGDFIKTLPSENGLRLVKAFASEAIRRKRLISDYKIYGLKSVANEGSDTTLFKQLNVWPQWSGIIGTV